jgi:endonuclease YncB( thermonuclease family)
MQARTITLLAVALTVGLPFGHGHAQSFDPKSVVVPQSSTPPDTKTRYFGPTSNGNLNLRGPDPTTVDPYAWQKQAAGQPVTPPQPMTSSTQQSQPQQPQQPLSIQPQAVAQPNDPNANSIAPGTEISGRAWVIDGHTLVIGEQVVRLTAMQSPALEQTCPLHQTSWRCGEKAKDNLAAMVSKTLVTCVVTGPAMPPAVAAVCRTPNNDDLGRSQVRDGLAVVNRNFFPLDYQDQEQEAKAQKRGMWAGKFVLPWMWSSTAP